MSAINSIKQKIGLKPKPINDLIREAYEKIIEDGIIPYIFEFDNELKADWIDVDGRKNPHKFAYTGGQVQMKLFDKVIMETPTKYLLPYYLVGDDTTPIPYIDRDFIKDFDDEVRKWCNEHRVALSVIAVSDIDCEGLSKNSVRLLAGRVEKILEKEYGLDINTIEKIDLDILREHAQRDPEYTIYDAISEYKSPEQVQKRQYKRLMELKNEYNEGKDVGEELKRLLNEVRLQDVLDMSMDDILSVIKTPDSEEYQNSVKKPDSIDKMDNSIEDR